MGVPYGHTIIENYKIYESIVLGGWVGGWMDGLKSRFKDCLQQSKTFIADLCAQALKLKTATILNLRMTPILTHQQHNTCTQIT